MDHRSKQRYPCSDTLVELKPHWQRNLEFEKFEIRSPELMFHLPLKLFPQAKKVKPSIVLLMLKTMPNVVSKFTISLAIE